MNEKETKIQNELKDAKQAFENNPSDSNATRFNAAQEQLEMFSTKRKQKGSFYVHELAGTNT